MHDPGNGGSGKERLAPAAGSSLGPGSLLAGRYEILRFIARGGMGEVYEARDTALGVRVALKVLLRDLASDAGGLERFKREIQLARKVTHANACRIFDLGFHKPAAEGDGPAEEIAFLTMELLEGETLADRIRRSGRLSPQEALPLVRQMVAGLASAHEAGVIHRDLKCGNVILAPAAGGDGGTRAVVTDFGLARAPASGDSVAPTLSLTGAIFGTPAYIAPEQLRGGPITPETDVYALGVVLFEMVTGALPFSGETPISAAVKRLTEAPPSPRTLVPDLDPRWERTILRCLEKEPGKRFRTTPEVLESLEGGKARAAWKKPALWAALAALLLLVAAGVSIHVLRRPGVPEPPRPLPAASTRKSVAVLWFKNLSGKPEKAWLSTALSEMINTELAAGEKLRVIPGENVARTKVDLALPDAPSLASDTLQRIRANLGADLVILGAYTALDGARGGPIRLDVRVQDAGTGETVEAFTESGTEAALFDLIAQAGRRLRADLGGGDLPGGKAGQVRALMPSAPQAARLYAEGLDRLRSYDLLSARDLLERAAALSPDYPMGHAALAEAWQRLGYREKARGEAKKAFDLSAGLPREERLAIEARYRETTSEWSQAVEIYASLWAFFPDNLEYGLQLARAQVSAGKPKESLATVAELRKLPSPEGWDPRIDLAEARAFHVLSDFQGMLTSSERAVAKARALGARLLVAQSLLSQGIAYRYLGDAEKARAALTEAGAAYEGLGDLSSQAKALKALSISQSAEYDYDGYERTLRETIALYRRIGDKFSLEGALQNLGHELQYTKGDLKGARELLEESITLCLELGERYDLSLARWKLGNVLYLQGDLAAAKKEYGESLALAREEGVDLMVAYDLAGLADVAAAGGDTAAAGTGIAESLAVFGKVQAAEARQWETYAHMKLALLRLDQGRRGDAEREAAEAVEELARDAHLQESEKVALHVQALVLAAQGKAGRARESMTRAAALHPAVDPPWNRTFGLLVESRVLAAEGALDRADETARRCLAEARRLGFYALDLEARLALGEIERRAGKTAEGTARLASLEKEARQKGYLLIAAKASGEGKR